MISTTVLIENVLIHISHKTPVTFKATPTHSLGLTNKLLLNPKRTLIGRLVTN